MGASSCQSAEDSYRAAVQSRLDETGGLSPVEIDGDFVFGSDAVSITATYRLIDAVNLDHLRATLLVYENGVHGPADPYGTSIYDGVTRMIYDQSITLASMGDSVAVSTTVPIAAGWVADSLHFVAYLQQTQTKEMIQAANLPSIPDYSVSFDHWRRSVPRGYGVAVFPATLTNVSRYLETLTLEPGAPFGGWTVDYLIGDDPDPHTGATDVVMGPNETLRLAVRVHTDAVRAVRNGSFDVTSRTTGRLQETVLRVYNGSPSIFLVDNDGTTSGEAPIVHALDTGGYLYESYNVNTQVSYPIWRDMDGYDVVIWETGHRPSAILTDAAAQALMTYLDRGGALFLTSQAYLNQVPAEGTPFTRDYLGVDSFFLDKGYHYLIGFSGDPIGNGLVLPLRFDYPSFYKGDDATPTSSARTVLVANDGSHAMLRNVTPSGAKTVFLAEAFNGISESDPDPNNTRVVLSRIITWLEPDQTVDVGATKAEALSSTITGVRPNPFNPATEIAFSLSPRGAEGPIRLEVFDPAGRRIALLLNGHLDAGVHSISWNGRADGGSAVRSGIYLARLTTLESAATWKLVLLK